MLLARPTERYQSFGRAQLVDQHHIMFTVYVLRDAQGKIYKGMTSGLQKRLVGHKSGNTRSTRGMRDISIVYQKIFETSDEARRYEKYLKSAAGRRFLKTRLQSGDMRP